MAYAKSGRNPDAIGRVDEWVEQRIQEHRNPTGPKETHLLNGDSFRFVEYPTTTGGTAGLRIDITESMRTESALRESETQLRLLTDSLPVVIIYVDLESRYVLANKLAEKWYARPRASFIGAHLRDVLGDEGLVVLGPYRDRVLAGETVNAEETLTYPDGITRTIDFTYVPHRNVQGEILGFYGLVMDISDRKRAEAAAKASESRLSGILDVTSDAIIMIDKDQRVSMFNKGSEKIFGHVAGNVIGQPLDILIPETFRVVHGEHIAKFDRSQDASRPMSERKEIFGLRKDGTDFPAEASITKLELNGETVFSVILRDITEGKQAENTLRTALLNAEFANKAKSEFLATMSHELRTPLNAIIGFSEMLSGQYFGALGSEKYVEYAGDIGTSGEHLLHLINDLLDLSVIEAGGYQLHKKSLNFQRIAADCVPMIAEEARRKGIVYTSDVPDNLPTINADRRALKQVVLNILSNAIKFTSEGGKINLKASASNDALIIEVRDTGVGISENKISNLTEPFVRGEPDPHKAQEGAGLGLAIVKSLVDLHDGDLAIKSEVGVGTAVMVTLPYGDVLKHCLL